MDFVTTIFSIAILICSIMFHELAHGTVAHWLGDPTARLSGRLTINPIRHLEWIGSFFVPLLCIISGSGFIIGWAKPIPFNPQFFKNKRWGEALVAIAGPSINSIFAIIGAIILRIPSLMITSSLQYSIATIVVVNIALAVFNLIPVPPLDGHHVVGAIFPWYQKWSNSLMQQYGIVIIILVIFLAGSLVDPIISFFINLAIPSLL